MLTDPDSKMISVFLAVSELAGKKAVAAPGRVRHCH